MQAALLNENVAFYGFCLMSNHVHLLIQVDKIDTLAIIMQFIAQDYARWHNFKYERTGHLFDNRYRSHPIQDYAQVISTLHYIHQNPLRAGLSSTCENYRWSSHNTYLNSYSGTKHNLTQNLNHIVNTNWIHNYYPTASLYQKYMEFERTPANPFSKATTHTNLSVLLDGPVAPSDQDYYQQIKVTLSRLNEECEALSLHDFEARKSLVNRRVSINACKRYWVICRIYEAYPTSTRQLGRVLGHSHNLVIRALASENRVNGKSARSR